MMVRRSVEVLEQDARDLSKELGSISFRAYCLALKEYYKRVVFHGLLWRAERPLRKLIWTMWLIHSHLTIQISKHGVSYEDQDQTPPMYQL